MSDIQSQRLLPTTTISIRGPTIIRPSSADLGRSEGGVSHGAFISADKCYGIASFSINPPAVRLRETSLVGGILNWLPIDRFQSISQLSASIVRSVFEHQLDRSKAPWAAGVKSKEDFEVERAHVSRAPQHFLSADRRSLFTLSGILYFAGCHSPFGVLPIRLRMSGEKTSD
jgi:hypothetical protein